MKISTFRNLFLVIALVSVTTAHGDEGAMLGDTCAGCHGLKGASAGATMPTIAGMSRDFLFNAMREFRSGQRSSTIMGRIARGYDDRQLALIADYFAGQPWRKATQPIANELLARGERLHMKRCEVCHRDGGTSMALDMQPLAGQWKDYFKLYMAACQEPGWKVRHPDAMSAICSELDARDIEALANYYANRN